MDDVKKAALEKTIRAALHPSHPFLTSDEITVEKVFETQAVAWVGDRLFWVPFKEQDGMFTLGKISRVSKAEVRKHQLDDGTPMTLAEEKNDEEEFRTKVTPQKETPNEDLTAPAKEEFQTAPAPNKVAEVALVAEDPCVVANAGNSAAVADRVAPSTTGKPVAEITDVAAAPKTAEVAAGYDLLTKHSFTEDQTKVKYLVESERKLPYTDEHGTISHARMGGAWAALHGGYRGNKYEGPDKDKAIARLKRLYEQEGLELPSEKTVHAEMEKIEASQASLEVLHGQFEELLKSLDVLAELGETDMTQAEKIAKARSTVAGHLANIKKALDVHKAAHESLHAAHDQMHEAHKAFHTAAKTAHDARQVHKAAHDAYVSKVSSGIDEIQKVLGGGPESIGEFGAPDSIDIGPEVGRPVDGSQAAGYGSEVPAIAAKAAEDRIKKAVNAALKAAGVQVPEEKTAAQLEEERIAKAVDAALVAVGVKKAAPAAGAPAAPQTEQERKDEIKKAAIEGLTEIFKAMGEADEPKPGVGDRSNARPFTKAEDNTGADGKGAVVAEVMTKTDWDAYRAGDQKAIRKAQALTSNKWQPVPDRIMKRHAGTN